VDGNVVLPRSQLGHTTEYTWDIEMVEPAFRDCDDGESMR
jgi:hypothetical protein